MDNYSNLFAKIQDTLPKMSKAKKAVGRYLLESWQEVALLSAAKVARQVGVSESVVVRFAQDLDYSGFPELQKALQSILRNRLTGFMNNGTNGTEIEPNSITDIHSSDAVQRVYDLTLNNLKSTLYNNQFETILESLDLILKSKRIAIVASRNAKGPALILSVNLNEIFTNTTLLSAGQDDLFDHLRSLTEEDLLISIGLPGYSTQTVRAIEFASKRGVPQITITDSLTSPLISPESVVLLTHFKSFSYANSHVGTVFLIDILLHLITIKDKGQVLKSLGEMDEIDQRYRLYEI